MAVKYLNLKQSQTKSCPGYNHKASQDCNPCSVFNEGFCHKIRSIPEFIITFKVSGSVKTIFNSFLAFDESPTHVNRWIRTGSKQLDYMISAKADGGLPEGRIVEIFEG